MYMSCSIRPDYKTGGTGRGFGRALRVSELRGGGTAAQHGPHLHIEEIDACVCGCPHGRVAAARADPRAAVANGPKVRRLRRVREERVGAHGAARRDGRVHQPVDELRAHKRRKIEARGDVLKVEICAVEAERVHRRADGRAVRRAAHARVRLLARAARREENDGARRVRRRERCIADRRVELRPALEHVRRARRQIEREDNNVKAPLYGRVHSQVDMLPIYVAVVNVRCNDGARRGDVQRLAARVQVREDALARRQPRSRAR